MARSRTSGGRESHDDGSLRERKQHVGKGVEFRSFEPILLSKLKGWSGLPRVAQMVKNLGFLVKNLSSILGQEDILEKGLATSSNILPWRRRIEEPGRLQFHGVAKSWDVTERHSHKL